MECFLCEEGSCYLKTIGKIRVCCSLFPDMDPESEKPLHILVAPIKHYESIMDMPKDEYHELMDAYRSIRDFYEKRGYGPAATTLELSPGPHTTHVHYHLIFSSNSLGPLKKRDGPDQVGEEFFQKLKKEIESFE